MIESTPLQSVCLENLETLKENHFTLKTLKIMHYLTNFLENLEKGKTFKNISIALIEIYNHVFMSQKTQKSSNLKAL